MTKNLDKYLQQLDELAHRLKIQLAVLRESRRDLGEPTTQSGTRRLVVVVQLWQISYGTLVMAYQLWHISYGMVVMAYWLWYIPETENSQSTTLQAILVCAVRRPPFVV